MDITIYSMLLVMIATFTVKGHTRCTHNGVQICISEDVNVTSGNAFTLSCLIWKNCECRWYHNRTHVPYIGRYSASTKYFGNVGHTLCIFSATKTNAFDNGNWTCAVSGDSKQQRIFSEGILVRVLPGNISLTNQTSNWSTCSHKHGKRICISKNVNVVRGSVFHLSCMISQTGSCTWKLHDLLSKPVINDWRYSFKTEWYFNGSTLCSLKVIDAQMKDSRNWTCGIQTSYSIDKIASDIIAVNVSMATTGKKKCIGIPHNNEYICLSTDVKVNKGTDFELSCTIYGNVQRHCYWMRNNQIITATGKSSNITKWPENKYTLCSLKVTKADDLDNGNWSCGISVGHDNEGMLSEGIKVDVFAASTSSYEKPRIIWHSKYANVYNGEEFQLSCAFATDVSCIWYRNKSPIKLGNGRYTSDAKLLDNGTSVCSVKVSEAESLDNGNWTCEISADDTHDGVKSDFILVTVHLDYANVFTSPQAPSNDDNKGTLYIIIGALGFIVVISVSICSFKIKRKAQMKAKSSPSPSVHVYEDINEDAIEFSSDPPLEKPYSHIQTPSSNPKSVKSNDGYEVPITPDESDIFCEKFGDEIDLHACKQPIHQQHSIASHPYQNITQKLKR